MKLNSGTTKLIGVIVYLILQVNLTVSAQDGFPKLILLEKDVPALKAAIGTNEIIKKSFAKVKRNADKALNSEIVVPTPKDPGGGYTHEKHKSNYREMYQAGLAFQLTGEQKYADFVKNMLLEYSKMYHKIGLHPQKKNQAPGKLFWQNLNETVWLVYSIQAYDCIIETLSASDKKKIETNVFREMIKFIAVDNQRTFDKVHNHGTWAVAGVGMAGYVLGDTSLVNKAIRGTNNDGTSGFLKQISDLFSPDGYYAEGPYYQRYALMPFILFAQAIANNQPELKIFEYNGKVLEKAVTSVLQLTNKEGFFFPINDGFDHKSYHTVELVYATDIAYNQYKNKNLLPIVREHGRVMLSGAGLAAATDALANTKLKFKHKPLLIRDGVDANGGGVALLRTPFNKSELTGIMKFTTQGMGHGHFDRMAIMMYDGADAILSDYGAARFLNVPAKHGGRYLPENKTWARQTISHNTVIADQTSHFNGKWKQSQKYRPALDFYDNTKDVQIVAAKDTAAYKGITMRRTLVMVSRDEAPFMIDLFKLESAQAHTYDYAFHYQGHLMETSFKLQTNTTTLKPLGKKNGYQHLWLEATAKALGNQGTFTWWKDKQFYSITTTAANSQTQFLLTRAGANDPEFNLRHQPSLIVREEAKKDHLFCSVIEPHGSFDPTLEAVQSPSSQVKSITVEYSNTQYAVAKAIFKNGESYTICIAFDSRKNQKHKLKINGKKLSWKGSYQLIKKQL